MAHDVGTSSNKAAIVSTTGEIIGTARGSYKILFPQSGWAEQDPHDWWSAVCQTSKEVLSTTKIPVSKIIGVCFSGQMAGTVPVDKEGNPSRNAISWLDTRSEGIAKKIGRGWINISGYGLGKLIKWLHITGGGPSLAGKDYTTQVLWVRDNEPAIWERTYKFLSVKGYLLFQSTGKFVITYDDGNLTWFMDTRKNKMRWSESLLSDLKFPVEKLPDLIKCTEIAGPLTGPAARVMGLREGTPVIGGGGDIVVATIGAGAVREKEGHAYIGTSDWITCHVEKRCVSPSTGTGAICSGHPRKYMIAAEQEVAGACLEWAQSQLYNKDTLMQAEGKRNLYEIFDDMVSRCEPGAKGLLFLPWMFGERVPIADPQVRGGLINLSLEHNRQHIIRAIFEGIALNMRWALSAVEDLIKQPLKYLKFTGGGAKSDIWCQILADVTQRSIWRMTEPQSAGTRGAALLASYALGYIKDFENIADLVPSDKKFDPRTEYADLYDRKFQQFRSFYKLTKAWFKDINTR